MLCTSSSDKRYKALTTFCLIELRVSYVVTIALNT